MKLFARPAWLIVAALIAAGIAVWKRGSGSRSPEGTAPAPFVYRPSTAERLFARIAIWIDQKVGWYNLPLPLGVAVIVGERITLRAENLHDTSSLPSIPQPEPAPPSTDYRTARTADGSFNDLQLPRMGSYGTRFGRNVPNGETRPEELPSIMEPSPRLVSQELLTRESLVEATTLNMLAAAWIQFMIRDWLSHGPGDPNNAWQVPLPPGDTWPQDPMLIPRTIADATRPPNAGAPPTYVNLESPWWDASQIYPKELYVEGSPLRVQLRTGVDGKLVISPQGLLPTPILTLLGQQPGWWLGLGLMFTLFALEHNSICDRLRAEYPSWTDDELFNRARLINAALIAKIHTVEWTPAIISHPTTRYALRANWWGLEGEVLHRAFGRLSKSDIISGIPGSDTDHHSAPYSLTEEFVAVYRMHPLIRDEYSFRRAADDANIHEAYAFDQITDVGANQIMEEVGLQDLLYSFGTLHPGAITLHNFPKLLQSFRRPDGRVIDLASIDIMRTRELGVPRYIRFRELMHMRPIRTFEELTDNPAWAAQLKEVYEGRLDRVDLMPGMFAERRPVGFGFSDTAFRIFILMASRRLKSDRFLTRDFTPEVYTPAGMNWLRDNSMSTVLLRHFPGLRPALRGVENAFAPWQATRG
jgi:hypothetical protein